MGGLSTQNGVDPQGNGPALPHGALGSSFPGVFLEERHIWVTCSAPGYGICHTGDRQGNAMQFGQEAEGLGPTTWKILCLLLAQSHAKKDEVLITLPSFPTGPLRAANSF